jgi:hypothetical protein
MENAPTDLAWVRPSRTPPLISVGSSVENADTDLDWSVKNAGAMARLICDAASGTRPEPQAPSRR